MQRFDLHFDADAAAEFSRTAAIGSQSMTFVEQRIIKFLQLDWGILHIPLAHRNRGRRSIFEGAAAPTAADNILADIASAGFRVRTEDRVTSHIAFVGRRDTLRPFACQLEAPRNSGFNAASIASPS